MWLSREDSNEAGKYHNDRAPYQREVLDTIWKQARTTLVWASQLGKTLILKIILGYYMHQEPSPILYVMPTLPLARTFSKRRISPMLRDVPVLRGKVKEARAKDSTNNALEKTFPGGVLTIVGAKSAASLSSNPIRIVLGDERDKWDISAGDAGDPFALAVQRTQNFDNRRIVDLGTPGIKDISPLEDSFENSDQRYYHIPCPSCGEFQKLEFGQLKWMKDGEGKVKDCWYECRGCKYKIVEQDKPQLLKHGQWIATFPDREHAGFHLNALYSPWLTWKDFAQNWSDAKHSNNPEILKQVINEKLAEWWDDKESAAPPSHELAKRIESYTAVPQRAVVLVGGVDVQENRLELLVTGWGEGEEKWHVDHQIIPGKSTQDSTWAALDRALSKTYTHESGVELSIVMVCVDSSAFTDHVYRYCKARQTRNVYAIKGIAGPEPIVSKPKIQGKQKILLYRPGVDTIKAILYQQLQIPKPEHGAPQPGYIHFNKQCDEEYFKQLTAEKLKLVKGRHKWVQFRANEILDLWNYNYAAFKLLNADIPKVAQSVARKAEEKKGEQPKPTQKKKKVKRSSWATMGGLLGRKF